MSNSVEKALALWGMECAEWKLIAARENRVFRVDHAGESFALRLHRAAYRTNAELRSELDWMEAVAASGLQVPAPIRSLTGQFLHVVDDIQVDLLTWLSGQPLGKTGEALQVPDRTSLFHRIGHEMAKLHIISDTWSLPDDFTRCAWDRKGLLGDSPLWDRFWDNATLSDQDRTLFVTVREHADAALKAVEPDLDYGLIHADLVRENVMIDGSKVQFIDFDDAGFGFRLFDIATTLIKNRQETDYPELKAALISGYRSQRAIDTELLDLFILLRALTYVGWIISRMNEDGSETRNQRFVSNARALAVNYLATSEEKNHTH